MKQPNNTKIYHTALYMRLSRDDENYGDSVSIKTYINNIFKLGKQEAICLILKCFNC